MLNIEVNRSAKGVEQYFDCELAVSDYLMKEPGIWAGRGAERLGLCGPVQRWQFVALLRNEDPTTGKRLTATYEYQPAVVMDVSGIAGAGKSHLLKQVQEAAVSVARA